MSINKLKWLILFLFYHINTLHAQNLVLNPSFENLIICPTGSGELFFASNWENPFMDCASPDLFNACASSGSYADVPINGFGYQLAQNGNGYAGCYTYITSYPNYREYIEGELSAPLLSGQEYDISFWVSLANLCNIYTSEIGLYFSDTLVQSNLPATGSCLFPFTPQLVNTTAVLNDTSNWQQLTWNYTAIGGERYFIIGNFKDSANIVVQTIDPIGLDQAYYYIDNIYVGAHFVGVDKSKILNTAKIHPTPSTDQLTLQWQLEKGENGQLLIFNALGQLVQQESLKGNIGQQTISLNQYPSGLYFCKLYFDGIEVHQDKLIIVK